MVFRFPSVGYMSNPDLPGHLLHRIATLVLATATLVLSVDWGKTGVGAEKHSVPNIIIILTDDMGYSDIGCFGGEIHTPNIDKLAAGGLRFTQFYNTARCCPSQATWST